MRTRRAILAGVAACAVCAIAGSTAYASVTYGPIGSFSAGNPEGVPLGVAVNQTTGDLYVGNFLSRGAGEYGPTGNLIKSLELGLRVSGIAVDPVNGNVYAINGREGNEESVMISTYGASGNLISDFSIAGSANFHAGETAAQIASNAAGDVYLPNAPNNEVQEFSPVGSVLQTITGSGTEALKAPTGVAVDAAGNVYVADHGNGRLEEFTAGGAFVMALGTGVNQTTGDSMCTAASKDTCGPSSDGAQSVAVDASGEIFVGENDGSGFHLVLYSPTGEELDDFGKGTIGTSQFEVIDTPAIGSGGFVYVTDGGNGVVWIYARERDPSLLSISSSAVTQSSAEVIAKIDPGNTDTAYHVEYGTSAAYGASTPVSDEDIGNGLSGPVVTDRELTGLLPGTTYHYRVVASNTVGRLLGPDETFTTPPVQAPVVQTGPASGVAQNVATLTGTIDTQGFGTVYEFDLGTDTSYGTRIFGNAGVEGGKNTFAFGLAALTPGATYHYRIVATNIFGTVYGADETFTTSTYPTSVLAVPATQQLVPAPLLSFANGSPTTVASRKPAGSAARHVNAKKSSGKGAGRKRRARGVRVGRAHGANGRGSK